MTTLTDNSEDLLQKDSHHGNTLSNGYNHKDARVSTPTRCQLSVRTQHAFVGLVFGVVLYIYRVNVSIALPYMVKAPGQTTNLTLESHSNATTNATVSSYDKCGRGVAKQIQDAEGAEFTWDKTTQSFVLSGYFYGYIVSQVPLTWATRRFGGKKVITTCMILAAVFILLVPILARASVYAVIVLRVLLGIASGATVPAWTAILGAWALPHERSRFNACHCFGKCAGSVIGYFTSGVLCAHGFDNGWGSVFYVHGAIGMLFVLLWYLIIADSPETHARISYQEKYLFERYRKPETQTSKVARVPWLSILTSVPVWTVYITHTFDNFTQYLILLSLPQFLKDVMRYDIQSNGGFSSLPSISNALGLVISGYMADSLIKRRWLSTTAIRKLFQTIALVGAAVFIVIPGYINCELRAVAIMCLCACLFFDALGQAVGYSCSAVDLAPRYASVIYSISNTLASLPGMLGPLAVAELTPNGTAEEWRVVFYIAAGLALFAAVIYGFFSSSEQVSWAEDSCNDVTIDVNSASEEFLREKENGVPQQICESRVSLNTCNISS